MNKGAIRTRFKELLNRNDCTDALADTFIEQSIARIQRTLRVPAMEKQQSYSLSAQTAEIIVPSDLLEIINIYHGFTVLVKIPLSEMTQHKSSGETGTPKYFSQIGEVISLFPEPSTGSVVVNYYGEFADMTSDTDENALAKFASDLIIYGALVYAADNFFDVRAADFKATFAEMRSEIQEQADSAEQSGSFQVVRPVAVLDDGI